MLGPGSQWVWAQVEGIPSYVTPTGVLESMDKCMDIGVAAGRRKLRSLLERGGGGQCGDMVVGRDVKVPDSGRGAQS